MGVSTTAFEDELRSGGFVDPETKSWGPDHADNPHAHPFTVRALVLRGELTVRSAGMTCHCKAGDSFSLDADTEHTEHVGPEGVTFLLGRKYPKAEAS